MLRDIIRKEIMDNISTLKFVVTFIVVFMLVITGLMLGSRSYLEQIDQASQQRLSNYELLTSQTEWFSAGYLGLIEPKIPHVLSTVDHGIDNSLGRQAHISVDVQARLDESRNLVSPILAVFGDVDLTFVVKIILSLFVILLSYDAISGEKERGTLKLTLANDVPRYRILLGKILGGFISIIIPFLLPLLIGLAFVMFFFPEVLANFNQDTWWRLLIILFVYLLYLVVYFALGLLISSLCHRSATSFIVLLMLWVLFVTIIPRLSVTAAERLRPYEAYTTLQTKAFKEISQMRRGALGNFFQERAGAAQAEGEIGELFADFLRIQSDLQKEVMDRYDRQFELQQASQIQLSENLSRFLSPTSAMTSAVQNLAGSGWARHQDYLRKLREFQNSFRTYVYEEIENLEIRSFATVQEDLRFENGLDIDRNFVTFDYEEEDLGTVVYRSIWDIGILAILAIVFFAAASVAFLRYDVR